MLRLEVSGAVRLIYRSLGVKGLNISEFEEICLCLFSSVEQIRIIRA